MLYAEFKYIQSARLDQKEKGFSMKTFSTFLLSLLILVTPLAASDKNDDPVFAVGDKAPTFTLPDMNNKYVFLRDFCGEKLRKPWINKDKYAVVMSFFATWCAPCMKEIPYLTQVAEQFRDKKIKFFLINVGEEKAKVEPFLKEKNITLPVLLDQYQVVAEKYGAKSLPTLVVLDQNGKVRKYKMGFKDGNQFVKDMAELLEQLSATE